MREIGDRVEQALILPALQSQVVTRRFVIAEQLHYAAARREDGFEHGRSLVERRILRQKAQHLTIGENDAPVRAYICAGLAWLGISLDEARNRAARNPVSDGASRCQVLVLASQEDEQIARHAWAALA